MMARISSKDVALHAGVSIATVSHVINGTRFVSDETRDKVLAAIESLNYRPNAIARGLATNSTHKIGLIISDITNPFFTAIARGVEDVISSYQYNTIFCNTDEDPQRETNYLNLLAAQHVDGIIISPTGVHCDTLLALANSGVPIVQLDRRSPNITAPLVAVDNEAGSYQAIRYLLELGHRRIAYVMGIDTVSTQTERLNGWQRALTEAGVAVDEGLIVRADPRFYGMQSGSGAATRRDSHHGLPAVHQAIRMILQTPQRPTAIFVANNQLTLGTLYALKEYGLRCPEDISLISFDDHDWAPLFNPPLSVVRQPTHKIGLAAAELVMKMVKQQPVDTPPLLPVELVIRASCTSPQAKP
ncbi:MAG: LacI family DNA-binding transcriptional regulator [Caldilineales bacterium]